MPYAQYMLTTIQMVEIIIAKKYVILGGKVNNHTTLNNTWNYILGP